MLLIDPNLGDLSQEDIAGVDIENQISTRKCIHDLLRDEFRHDAGFGAGESPVHVQVKPGDPALYRADPQRVQSRVDLHRAVEQFLIPVQGPRQKKADLLSLQLIPVDACDNADAPAFSVPDHVSPDPQRLIYRQPDADDIL